MEIRREIPAEVPVPKKEFKMLVVGDIMLDRLVRRQMMEQGDFFPFEQVRDFLSQSGADIVEGNLEGPITHYPSKTIDFSNKVLQFTFATNTAEILRAVGFTHLGLANNHALNFGPTGITETRDYLAGSNLGSFGDPKNQDYLSVVADVRGLKIGLVGYHAFEYGIENVLAEIIRLRPHVNLLFVFPHWGNEYELTPTDGQKYLGHKMIDLGADAVFGAHPHVVQPIEIYKGKPIFYSLGNFIFDQDFSTNTKIGLAVIADFTETGATFSLQPIANLRGQASLIPLDDDRSKNLLTRINSHISPDGVFSLPFVFSTSTPTESLKVE